MTNFERIKGMSVEELNHLLSKGGTGSKLIDFGCKLGLEIKKTDELLEKYESERLESEVEE